MSNSEVPKKRRYRKKEKELSKDEKDRLSVENLKAVLEEGVFDDFEQYSSVTLHKD